MIHEVQPEPEPLEGAMRVTFDMQNTHIGDEFVVRCPPLATIRRLSIVSGQLAPPPGEPELPLPFAVTVEFDSRTQCQLTVYSTAGTAQEIEWSEADLFVPEGATVRLRFRIRTMPQSARAFVMASRSTRWLTHYWPPVVQFMVQLVGRARPKPECSEHVVDNQGCCHQCGVLLDRFLWEAYAGKGAPFP